MGTEQWIHVIEKLDYTMALKGALVFIMGLIVSSLASHWTKRALNDRLTDHQQLIVGRLTYYVVLFLFVVGSLRQFGFETDTLLTLAGLIAVALGFAAKDSMGNLVSGFFLMAERPVSIGDRISLNNHLGYIASIDLFSIKIRTLDNAMIRMSNVTFLNSEFVNLTRYPLRRSDVTFYLQHGQNLVRIREQLLSFAESFSGALIYPSPEFFVLDLDLVGMKCKLGLWVHTEFYTDFRTNFLIGFNEEIKKLHIQLSESNVSLLQDS